MKEEYGKASGANGSEEKYRGNVPDVSGRRSADAKNKKIFKLIFFALPVLLFMPVLFSGCAPMEPDVIHHLKTQVKKLNKKTAELSKSNKYLEAKLRQMQLNLANNGVKISSLDSKISDIYGRYEVESHELDILQKRFGEYRIMVNKELIRLLKLAKVQPALPVKKSLRTSPAEKANSRESSFKKAMEFYNNKNYAGAARAFGEFLDRHPQSRYAADAMFYRAEANFNLKKYPVSILEFHKFSQFYPKNSHVPTAIYLQGVGFLKVSDPSDASILFRQVIAKYPASEAAGLSKKALKRLSR